MVIGSGERGVGGMALLYSSNDMKSWTYLHPLAVARADTTAPTDPARAAASAMWECPEFFFLAGKPVLLVARGNGYLMGSYVDHKFEQQIAGQIDYGSVAYAQKTMADDKGRRIWWAWIREKRSASAQVAAGWAGVMSLPKVLTMQADGKLGVEPVAELKALRRTRKTIASQPINPNSPLLLEKISGDCVEIAVSIDLGNAQQAGLRVRYTSDGSEQTLIGYDRESSNLFCDTTQSSSDPETSGSLAPRANRGIQKGSLSLSKGELLQLRVFVDAPVLETFANGKVSLSERVYPSNPASLGIGLFAKGGSAQLHSMEVWELSQISSDRLTSGAELFRV
jgi:beta-fructofuranosidase